MAANERLEAVLWCGDTSKEGAEVGADIAKLLLQRQPPAAGAWGWGLDLGPSGAWGPGSRCRELYEYRVFV